MSSAAITPDEVIARVTEWQGCDVRWEELGGGITNFNYAVTVTGVAGTPGVGKFVLRIPGQGTDTFIDRQRELKNHVAAANAGVTPPLLHLVEPGHCTVVPFIDGETMHPDTIAGHPDRLEKIVRAVRTYHDRAVFDNDIHVFDMIREYTAMARDVAAPRPAEFDQMYAVGEAIEAAMERDRPSPTACHCDLLSENFILDGDGKMWVIDWEYGGMADPYFDLGDFCVEHPFSADEERSILTWYCGAMDEHRYCRMMLHKLVADLWWSIWAMIQSRLSQIDFDFYEYGMNRIRRFGENAASPDYERWLAGV
jgi:thiamine kinase-like enzyme